MLVDFAKLETLPSAMAGIDTVFLVCGAGQDQAEREINVVRAAESASVKRLVKTSIWRADKQQYALARLHRKIGPAFEGSGLAWTFLRPNGFMQNS